MIPALALLCSTGYPLLLPTVFLLLGSVQDGLWMTGSTVILESVEDRDRPLMIGVASAVQAPTALYGVFGGLIAGSFAYPAVFACGLGVTGAGFLAAMRVSRKLDA